MMLLQTNMNQHGKNQFVKHYDI